MSLEAAVLEIAGEMEKVANRGSDIDPSTVLLWSKMIQLVVKSCEGKSPTPKELSPDEIAARDALKKDQEERRKRREQTHGESNLGEDVRMAEMVGGHIAEGAPTCVPVSVTMPLGAYMRVANDVYFMGKDGRLHFSKEQTERWKEAKGKQMGVVETQER